MIKRFYNWLWPWFFYLLPARFVYYCGIRIWSEATTGRYDVTVAPEILMSESIARFSRIHGLGGSGEDEHWDSNR